MADNTFPIITADMLDATMKPVIIKASIFLFK